MENRLKDVKEKILSLYFKIDDYFIWIKNFFFFFFIKFRYFIQLLRFQFIGLLLMTKLKLRLKIII